MALKPIPATTERMLFRGRVPVLKSGASKRGVLLVKNVWGVPVVVVPYWVYRGGRDARFSNFALPFVFKVREGVLEPVKPLAQKTLYARPDEEYGIYVYPLRELLVEPVAAAIASVTREKGKRREKASARLVIWTTEEGDTSLLVRRVEEAIGLRYPEKPLHVIVWQGLFFTTKGDKSGPVMGFLLYPEEGAAFVPLPYILYVSGDGREWVRVVEGKPEEGVFFTEGGYVILNPKYYFVYEKRKRKGRLEEMAALDWKLPDDTMPEALASTIYEDEWIEEEGDDVAVEKALERMKEQVERGQRLADF